MLLHRMGQLALQGTMLAGGWHDRNLLHISKDHQTQRTACTHSHTRVQGQYGLSKERAVRDKCLEACEYSPLTSLSNTFLTFFFLVFYYSHKATLFVRLEEKAGL